MTGFLTNDIETNSFIGLITNKTQNAAKSNFRPRIFVKVESWQVLRNVAVAMALIVIGMTAGSLSQQKMDFAHNPAPATRTGV